MRILKVDDQIEIWKAINEYAESCGGDTSNLNKALINRRMDAVVKVNSEIEKLLNKKE